MTTIPDLSQPPDICLLLRAYAEQRWLTSELQPQLRELERADAACEEQLAVGLAYLEVLWLDARRRAAGTDAAFDCLDLELSERPQLLNERARRYYLAVRRLRVGLHARVRTLTAPQLRASDTRPDAWCSPS